MKKSEFLGVVETGFFIGVAEAGYFGTSDGKVKKLTPKALLRLPYTEEGVEDLLATT